MSIEQSSKEQALSAAEQSVFDHDVRDLEAAEQADGMSGALTGRTRFGLDPASMMSLRDTAPLTNKIVEALGTTVEKVWPLIQELHARGPWGMADRLNAAADPEIRAYIVMAAATHEMGSGYTPRAYLADRARVVAELGAFSVDKFAEYKQALEEHVEGFEDQTTQIEGVTVKIACVSSDAALALAVKGYQGCVVRFNDLRFAQTAEIPDALLEEVGLVKGFGEKYDPAKQGFGRFPSGTIGARQVWVKKEDAAKDIAEMTPIVKRISPGYCLTYKDEAMALDLVRKVVAQKQKGKV